MAAQWFERILTVLFEDNVYMVNETKNLIILVIAHWFCHLTEWVYLTRRGLVKYYASKRCQNRSGIPRCPRSWSRIWRVLPELEIRARSEQPGCTVDAQVWFPICVVSVHYFWLLKIYLDLDDDKYSYSNGSLCPWMLSFWWWLMNSERDSCRLTCYLWHIILTCMSSLCGGYTYWLHDCLCQYFLL